MIPARLQRAPLVVHVGVVRYKTTSFKARVTNAVDFLRKRAGEDCTLGVVRTATGWCIGRFTFHLKFMEGNVELA
jgi:hypothetical protein